MGYSEALEAAGAKIIAFQEFGSYQGDWFAFVEYQGKCGWVQGSYGSCSGCDAFESEFSYTPISCSEHEYEDKSGLDCSDCESVLADYKKRLAEFGASYLDGFQNQDEIEWDIDAAEELAFVKSFRDYVVSA